MSLANSTPPLPDIAMRAELSRKLGAADWQVREEATRAILDLGRDGVPWLRELLQQLSADDQDLETRNRVEWLLEQLAPGHRRARVLELGDLDVTPGSRTRGLLQWVDLDVPQGRGAEGTTTGPGGVAQRVLVEIFGDHEGTQNVWLEFPDDSDNMGSVYSLAAHEFRLCFFQDHFAQDHFAGKIERDARSSVWLVWLSPPGSSTSDAPLSVSQVEAQLRDACARMVLDPLSDNREVGLALAAFWARSDLVPDEPPMGDQESHWLVKTRAGDAAAREKLEAWFVEAAEDSAPGGEFREHAALALTERRFRPAYEYLVRTLADMAPWTQHRSVLELNRLLEPGTDREREALAETARDMIRALLDRNSFTSLPWHSSELTVLFQRLRGLAPEEFHARILEFIENEESFDPERNVGAGRMILQSLIALSPGHESTTAKWFDSFLMKLIDKVAFCEEALCVARDLYLGGVIDAVTWERVMAVVERTYRSTDQGAQNRTDTVMRNLVHCPAFTADQRRAMWLCRLSSYDAPGYLPTRVDRDLADRFGALDAPMPQGTDPSAPSPQWQERAVLWRARLEAADLETVRPAGSAAARSYQLVECLFRIDDTARTARLLRFESGTYEEGIAYPATGPSGEDRTRLLRVPEQGRGARVQVEVGNGRYAMIGRPGLGGSPGRDMYMELIQRDDRYGARADRRRTVQYQVFTLLNETDSVPILSSWPEVVEYLATQLTEAEGQDLKQFVDLAGRLRLTEWSSAIVSRFEAAPTPVLARALMQLGDDRGLETLRTSIDANPNFDAVESLRQLVLNKDAWAIDRALSWLEDPPAPVKNQLYPVVDALDGLSSARDASPVDPHRFTGALIASLDQEYLRGRAIPALRRLTGREFGYLESYTMADRAEQKQTQTEAVAKWRAWWADEVANRKSGF